MSSKSKKLYSFKVKKLVNDKGYTHYHLVWADSKKEARAAVYKYIIQAICSNQQPVIAFIERKDS